MLQNKGPLYLLVGLFGVMASLFLGLGLGSFATGGSPPFYTSRSAVAALPPSLADTGSIATAALDTDPGLDSLDRPDEAAVAWR